MERAQQDEIPEAELPHHVYCPSFLEIEDSSTKEYTTLERVQPASLPLHCLSLLRHLYRDCRLSPDDMAILEYFVYAKHIDPLTPTCTIQYHDVIEEDRDNDVFLRVRRYIQLSYNPRHIELLKTADIINKQPNISLQTYYSK